MSPTATTEHLYALPVNESGDGGISSCHFALLVLTPKLLTSIQDIHAQMLAMRDPPRSLQPFHIKCFDYSPYWIEACHWSNPTPEEVKLVEDLENQIEEVCDFADGPALFEQPVDLDKVPVMRTECDSVVIGHDYFYWEAYIKHTDTKVSTEHFYFRNFKNAALLPQDQD